MLTVDSARNITALDKVATNQQPVEERSKPMMAEEGLEPTTRGL